MHDKHNLNSIPRDADPPRVDSMTSIVEQDAYQAQTNIMTNGGV